MSYLDRKVVFFMFFTLEKRWTFMFLAWENVSWYTRILSITGHTQETQVDLYINDDV